MAEIFPYTSNLIHFPSSQSISTENRRTSLPYSANNQPPTNTSLRTKTPHRLAPPNNTTHAMAELLTFPASDAQKLAPYLPPPAPSPPRPGRPFVTLTFATSLDSAL